MFAVSENKVERFDAFEQKWELVKSMLNARPCCPGISVLGNLNTIIGIIPKVYQNNFGLVHFL